jgi:peptidylprolyl isomerase
LLATSTALAQRLPDIPTPQDVSTPPVEAVKSPSGLVSKIVTPGSGTEKPQEADFVTVHYSGWTSEGRLFDSSHARNMPNMFALNRVMAGWRECVLLMTVGETRRCWVPQNLAFNGQAGRPTGTVVFDIELLDIRATPNVAPPDVAAPPADAKSTPSGLYYKVIKPGTGTRHPAARDNVTVHYSGWTTAGALFDSTVVKGAPVTLDLNNVIRGWTEGLQLMVEGERTRFWIPEKAAYKGERGKPRGMLVFDIDLIKIEPPARSRF